MRIAPETVLIALFFLASGPHVSAAEMGSIAPLRLVATAGSQTFDRFAIEKNKIVVGKDEHGYVPAPPAVKWSLVGDLRKDTTLVFPTPWYYIAEQPPMIDAPGIRHTAVIRVDNYWPWEKADLREGLMVVVWIVDGKPVLVSPVPAQIKNPPNSIAATQALDLRPEMVHGHPVILLLKNNQFIAPSDRFGDARDEIARKMNLGLLAEAEALAEKLPPDDQPTASGTTLLHCAAAAGHRRLVEILLAHGINARRETARLSPLHLAAGNGRLEIVDAILPARSRPVNASDYLPIDNALAYGHMDVAFRLWETSSKSRAKDLAIQAVVYGRRDLLEKLLAANADIGAASIPAGAVARRILMQDDKTLQLLLSHGLKGNTSNEDVPLLIFAAHSGNSASVAALLAAHATVDRSDPQGTTPLMVAAQNGSEEIVDALLKAGADPNRKNKTGATALHFAAANGTDRIVTKLLTAGARTEHRNKDGKSALDLALETQSASAVQALVAAGARLDLKASPSSGIVAALTLDQSELLERASADGWKPDRPLFENFSLRDVAEACQALRCTDWIKASSARGVVGVAIEPQPDSPARPIDGRRPLDPRPRQENQPAATVQVCGLVDSAGRFLFPRIEQSTDVRLTQAVLRAIPTWKFAPARKNQQAVNAVATLSLGFKASAAAIFDACEVGLPPVQEKGNSPSAARLVSSEVVRTPKYEMMPMAFGGANGVPQNVQVLRQTGLDETIVNRTAMRADEWTALACVVEPDGNPSNVTAIASTSTDFAMLAIEAMEKYRFSPGIREGQAVRTRIVLMLESSE
jgi:ankyrin repeat protein